MRQLRPALQRAVLGILVVSLIGCPLTFAAAVAPLGSVALAQGPIQFTPDVAPLVTEEPPDSILEDEVQFTSSDAMQLCGSELLWGDGTMGMCLAPGGNSYYVWTGPSEVMIVPVDATNPNQLGFLQAVIDRSANEGRMDEAERTAALSFAGLFITVVGFPFACAFATLVGCIIDGAAVLVTAGLLAEAANSYTTDREDFETHSVQAKYHFCRMQGNTDQACRDAAGITPEQLGGSGG
ncbi:MAG TPA: hypothetical protein VI729_10400 [Anaerolineales bacterium]|nr:hypothetical protein [Anaerolineales bacterium]